MKPKKITGTLDNLCSKIERFKNPDKPKTFKLFFDACHEVLGFQVGTEHSEDGKYMALIIDENDRNIPLESMGTGVANILGIIADVCTANDKIFLIEELENDIHPKALKALLRTCWGIEKG